MIAIVAIASIVGLVWGLVLLRRGNLTAGCLAVLLVGSCFGHEFFHLSALTADRVLIVGLVIAYAWFRRFQWADPKPIDKADVAFAIFLAVLTCNTLATDWQLHGSQPLATLLFFYLMPVVLYWVGRQSKLTAGNLRTVHSCVAVFGVYLALTAIAETQQWWWAVFPKFIAKSTYQEFLGRGRGPFLNPVGCGMYLSVGLFAAVAAWPRVGRVSRARLLAVAALMLAGIYCTLTRSVWLGAGLGSLSIVGLSVPQRWRMPLVVALLLCGALGVAVKGGSFNSFKRDKHVSAYDMAQSAKLRPILATVAWKMFLDRPFFGCGFGQYKEYDLEYLHTSTGDLPLALARPYVQHNVFLALLVEVGAVGLCTWLLTLLIWTRNAWRLWCNAAAPAWARHQALIWFALIAAYTVNGLFHDVGIITMVNALLFFTAGITQGVALQWQNAPRGGLAFPITSWQRPAAHGV